MPRDDEKRKPKDKTEIAVNSTPDANPPTAFDAIPNDIREMAAAVGVDLTDPKSAKIFLQSVTFTRRSSPYPDIETAEKWEKLHPGSAKIFLEMPRDQALHRQSRERVETNTDSIVRICGTIFGGAVALGSVYAAYLLASNAKQYSDYAIVVILLVIGVGGSSIIPRLIEKLPKYTISRDKMNP